jgi:hypothetical protein
MEANLRLLQQKAGLVERHGLGGLVMALRARAA